MPSWWNPCSKGFLDISQDMEGLIIETVGKGVRGSTKELLECNDYDIIEKSQVPRTNEHGTGTDLSSDHELNNLLLNMVLAKSLSTHKTTTNTAFDPDLEPVGTYEGIERRFEIFDAGDDNNDCLMLCLIKHKNVSNWLKTRILAKYRGSLGLAKGVFLGPDQLGPLLTYWDLSVVSWYRPNDEPYELNVGQVTNATGASIVHLLHINGDHWQLLIPRN